jgi:hypothetical protein
MGMDSEPVHLQGDWVGWLRPEDELEEIELGARVSDWLTDAELAAVFGGDTVVRHLIGAVASATSWRGLPFPPEWWPPGIPGPPSD